MEQKLAEFRARRQAFRKEEAAQQSAAEKMMDTSSQGDRTQAPDSQHTEERTEHQDPAQRPPKDSTDWLLDSALGRWLSSRQLVLSNLTLLKVLLWLVLLGLFVELEFGLPFFVISLFYWLYEGLRSPTAREPGEMSAYSVFNPDCQPLLGTLTAEQLEGEMGYRPLANR